MKKFLKFLLFLIIVAIVIFLVSKNYTANILRKSAAKLDELEGKDLKLVTNSKYILEDGTIKETRKSEHNFYQGDYSFVNPAEGNEIYVDSSDDLMLLVNKNNGKEIYMVSPHKIFHYEKVKTHFPILFSDTDTLLAWDDSLPIYINLSKLLYTPSFTKSASENGRNYYVITTNDSEFWIDKGDYRLYKYIDKSETNILQDGEKIYRIESTYDYENTSTSEDIEWPDLTGKDVVFI
jgi:hypothetical protein